MADQPIDPAAQEARPVSIKQMLNLKPTDAIAFLQGKGYRTSVDWAEMIHEDHERAFTVAKIARRDILESVRRSLDNALAAGTPFEQWREQLQPELEAAGWWGRVQDPELTGTDRAIVVGPRRLRTIYDTNLRTARAAALWQRIQAGKEAMPFLRYSAVLDRRTRPLHRHWHGTVLPVDHPWWQTHFPPNGWQCRCTVVQMNQRMLDARGLKVSTPPDDGPPQLFRRRGATAPVPVPRGIDPGFGYTPGRDYLRSLAPAAGDAELVLPSRAAPTFPMPEPRTVPASLVGPRLQGDRDSVERAYLQQWREAVGVDDDGLQRLVLTDPTGEPTVVDESFWRRPDGSLKIGKPDHGEFAELIALTLQDPDEIWEQWDSHDPGVAQMEGAPPHQARLIRKLIARFMVDGRTQPIIVMLQVGKGGWYGLTGYRASPGYVDRRRSGTLTYRRQP